jgi:hypothetical protein
LGQHYFVRAQAAQAAPNIWLESLHLGTLRGNPVEIFEAQFGAPLSFLNPVTCRNQGRRCFPLAASASSTKRRIASEREGLSGWRLAHASTSAVNARGARKASIGSLPVPGRPRFLGITFLLDTLATEVLPKFAGR